MSFGGFRCADERQRQPIARESDKRSRL